MIDRTTLIQDLEEKLQHPDYVTDYFSSHGLSSLFVGEGTLGPEQSWVAQHLTSYLLTHPELYHERDVLDMGSGSGVQAVVAARCGARRVLAADISPYAIRSVQRNVELLGLQNMASIQSDLFDGLDAAVFDVIIFNHPFMIGSPRDAVEGIYVTGSETLTRFFRDARKHLVPSGILIMPFSHFGDHDPRSYAARFGYSIAHEESVSNAFGGHSIYLIRP